MYNCISAIVRGLLLCYFRYFRFQILREEQNYNCIKQCILILQSTQTHLKFLYLAETALWLAKRFLHWRKFSELVNVDVVQGIQHVLFHLVGIKKAFCASEQKKVIRREVRWISWMWNDFGFGLEPSTVQNNISRVIVARKKLISPLYFFSDYNFRNKL